MVGNHRAMFSLAFVLLILISPFSLAQDEVEPIQSASGGHTVIMEQFTAAWCPVCATVDPWLPEWDSERGSRVSRIALHDTTDDPLGTPVTAHRLARMNVTNPPAPSFWFDGADETIGSVSKFDLDRSLLSAESARASDSLLSIDIYEGISNDGDELVNVIVTLDEESFLNGSQVSVFILGDAEITPAQAINGITEHHDVVLGYAEAGIDDAFVSFNHALFGSHVEATEHGFTISVSYLIQHERIDELKIIAIHEMVEPTQDANLLGAMVLDFGESDSSGATPAWLPLTIIGVASAAILTIRSRR